MSGETVGGDTEEESMSIFNWENPNNWKGSIK